MALKVKSAPDGKFQIVDAFGKVIQDGIEDLNRAQAICATRNALGDEGKAGDPEASDDGDDS